MRQHIPIGFLGALVLVAGCSGQAPPSASWSQATYDFTSEGTFPQAPNVAAAPTSASAEEPANPSAKPDLTSDSVEDTGAAVPGRQSSHQGWSVQVFAGRSKDVASRIQRQLQSAVSEAVYVDYIEPFYKVRVGDCEEREECDTLQKRLRDLGSDSAWVVPRTIQGAVQP